MSTIESMTEEQLMRAREALGSFLAAALRSVAPEDLAALPGSATVSIEVPAASVRRALLVYEDELVGNGVAAWIEQGRSRRGTRSDARAHPGAPAPYRLEVIDDGNGVAVVFGCRDLDEVRDRITAAAVYAVDAVETALGLGGAGGTAGDLAAMLGRQAYRRLVGELRASPGSEATFDLPDRPWLRLADRVAPADGARV